MDFTYSWEAIPLKLEAFALRLEAIATRLEVIASTMSSLEVIQVAKNSLEPPDLEAQFTRLIGEHPQAAHLANPTTLLFAMRTT